MFSCQCLNVSITIPGRVYISGTVASEVEFLAQNGLGNATAIAALPRPEQAMIDRLVEGKTFELVSFFKEAVGPFQDTSVTVQVAIIQKTIPCDGWNVAKCDNCGCLVYACEAQNPASFLVNASCSVTHDQVSRLMAHENYSPAYRIVLKPEVADFRGFLQRDQYRSLLTAAANLLDSTNDTNELLESMRAYMRIETQVVLDRIELFTQKMNEQLNNVRERAEQDYLYLSQTFPNGGDVESKSPNRDHPANGVTEKALGPLLTGLATPVAAATVGGQLETPPPTPEYMPMSTNNSPPANLNGTGGSTPGSGQKQPNGVGALSNSAANTINNNNTTANSSNQGAINKPPTQQQQLHSTSTNLFASFGNKSTGVPGSGDNQQSRPARQLSMFDSDCLFDIDGMENDKTPPADVSSEDEPCDYDDESDNNNQSEGILIPRHQVARQTSAIARSLPISMPKMTAPFRANEDDLDEMAEDTLDIAASIKALAKSVHGEAVFGDLPRRQIQKFTSQI
ncbi:uncharacterized protein LOC128725579 [Anopheles nili]|uniref:uncharacterized protein LOC128725579 n=1 Tax=Anopheles nili TaxID=185578 RepID=UPI00237BCE04|nr:uncharacterized protein LOC128725579 [Anopheles nili]